MTRHLVGEWIANSRVGIGGRLIDVAVGLAQGFVMCDLSELSRDEFCLVGEFDVNEVIVGVW